MSKTTKGANWIASRIAWKPDDMIENYQEEAFSGTLKKMVLKAEIDTT